MTILVPMSAVVDTPICEVVCPKVTISCTGIR